MRVSTTADGRVTLSGMDPDAAEALVDLVRDLCSGDAVVLYGPGYEPQVLRPSESTRDGWERLLHADAAYPGALSPGYDHAHAYSGVLLLPETHRSVWTEIERGT